ncbi:hypothetical protein MTR67_026623 [Solanum verrucosum]|uniref:Uncharacterized protein n=1 Tax=Solanum verrucosum TaxID=315347 RepID=A0AAF0R235_SOLVR|nr:hypothetical protein MTR67_026623 [Solanum verrucosum]
MVDDLRIRIILSVVGLTRLSSKETKAAMLIGYMGIARLMIHVQHVEKDQLRNREEFKNKRVKTSGNESGQQKSNANRSFSNISRKDMLHHLLVHLHQRTNVSKTVRILRTSELDLRIRKVVRHKESVLRVDKVMVIGAIDPSLLQLLHQTELHLDERLQGLAEKKTIFMLTLVAESNRIR